MRRFIIILSYTTFASSRSSAENGTDQARRDRALARVYTGVIHPTPPHSPSPHDPTQIQFAGTPLPRSSPQSQSRSPGSSRLHRPPSSVRSKSTSPSGPYSSSVDTPTVTQYPSAAQDGPVLTSHPRNTHTQPPKPTSTSPHTLTAPIDVNSSA